MTYNFHSPCKHMHLSFNKEHKGAICNMTSSSNSSQSTRPLGQVLWENYLSCLDFTRNYELMSGIFVPFTVTMLSNQTLPSKSKCIRTFVKALVKVILHICSLILLHSDRPKLFGVEVLDGLSARRLKKSV